MRRQSTEGPTVRPALSDRTSVDRRLPLERLTQLQRAQRIAHALQFQTLHILPIQHGNQKSSLRTPSTETHFLSPTQYTSPQLSRLGCAIALCVRVGLRRVLLQVLLPAYARLLARFQIAGAPSQAPVAGAYAFRHNLAHSLSAYGA
jgi:hypothetical protein